MRPAELLMVSAELKVGTGNEGEVGGVRYDRDVWYKVIVTSIQ